MSSGNGNTEHANTELMRAMGSKKGSDPIPPDQYLCFLTSKDPEQQFLAWVRSKTIRHKHRSPHCVDERGHPLSLSHAAADLRWSLSYASRICSSLKAKGLVDKDEAGKIYLCGSVPPLKEELQKFCTGNLPEYILKQINNFTPVKRAEFERKYAAIHTFCDDINAEVIAAGRAATAPFEARLFAEFEIKKRKHKNGDGEETAGTPKSSVQGTPKCSVQLTLLAEPDFGVQETKGVAGNFGVQETKDSVQAAEASVYSGSNGGVQATPSIKSSEVHSSENSGASARSEIYIKTETPTTTPSVVVVADPPINKIPEPEAPHGSTSPILKAFEPFGSISDTTAKNFVKECLDKAPDAVIEEITAMVADVGATFGPNIRNPVGLLLKKVPMRFEREAFAKWRRDRANPLQKSMAAGAEGIDPELLEMAKEINERKAREKEKRHGPDRR